MKVLVVGAGISGCVVARELAEAGHIVTVIDEREHVGGNCYDFFDETGTRVHKYGPHIFHTDSDEAFEWLSEFTHFVDYRHKVKAVLDDGRYVTLPVNRETAAFFDNDKERIIETFFRPYTEKMWGMPLEKVAKSILDRVPIRDDDNELYFPDDKYQGMPVDGYTDMFMGIIDHVNIQTYISTPYEGKMKQEYDHVFWSGSIDEYYGCSHGTLGYRSLKFHHVTLPHPGLLLPVPTVNFTHTGPYTRMTEWKGYPNHGINPHYTSLMYEEPCDYIDNGGRFYPTKNDGNSEALLKMYQAIDSPYVTFIGRCGLYKYMDMDDAVLAALDTARDFINDHCSRN